MPIKKERFSIVQDNMAEAIDIDDSRGRSIPVNMNFIETGYLTKDTGFSLLGATETTEVHSTYNFKKKNGTSYLIRAKGTKIQKFNTTTNLWEDTTKTITANAKFGYVVDSANDLLYACNTVDTAWKWDGTTFTDVAAMPKGNILEIFEGRMYISGVTAEPLAVYYSKIGDYTNWTVSSTEGGIIKPLGVDKVTSLKNYYGYLIIFKEKSIWRTRQEWNTVTSIWDDKQELQSGTYGACSRGAVVWVENDLWFFTGKEVRAFGFKDQQTGVMGMNESVISEPIKETLKNIPNANLPYIYTYYNNRRYYLAVSLSSNSDINTTVFVCHTLYNNSWTKYTDRDKSKSSEIYAIDNVVYSVKNVTPFAVLKWDDALLDDNGTAITSSVTFKKVEDKDFNLYNVYRYLDLMLKNLQGKIEITVFSDKSDIRNYKTKTFYVGEDADDMDGSLGETPFGNAWVADSFGEDNQSSPFIKKRVSFLSKAQSLTIKLLNNGLTDEFTIAQFAIYGFKQPKNQFSPSGIVSIK